MNRIVQLSDWEYEELKKEAEMTAAAMDAEIERQIQDKCKLTVELKLNVGNDWNDVFSIKPVVYAHSGYHARKDYRGETVNALSYSACRDIADHIKKWMEETIRKRYKVDVDTINKSRKAQERQWKWNVLFLILSITGWLVSCFSIFS